MFAGKFGMKQTHNNVPNTIALRHEDRARELWVACRVANAINERDGSYLYAVSGNHEPEDAVLVSRVDSRCRIPIQVVSTPRYPQLRSDNKNLRHFEYVLKQELKRYGFVCGHFSVSWREDAVRYGLDRTRISALAVLIRTRMPGAYGRVSLSPEEEYAENPWLCDVANWVHGLCIPELTDLTVTSPTSSYLPRDGRWIAEAIAHKTRKYGKNGCSGVTLIVDGNHYLDCEQIDAFRTEFVASDCPFDHLWVISLGAATQIK